MEDKIEFEINGKKFTIFQKDFETITKYNRFMEGNIDVLLARNLTSKEREEIIEERRKQFYA
jgi:hypothetical protein